MRNRWRDVAVIAALVGAGVFVRPIVAAPPSVPVTMTADDGAAVTGTLYPTSVRPAPAVILLPMQTRSRDDWQPFASRLADAGLVALAIDLRGRATGEREALQQAVRDVKAARLFLSSRPDVNGRVGLAGASIGANIGMLAAAGDPAVRSVALLSAGLDYRGLRLDAAMRKYADRPALLVASLEDPYAARSARQLAGLGDGVRELRLLSGAGHGTVMLEREPDVAAALVDWFRRTLL